MHDALAEADPPETDEALRAYVKARDAVVDLLRDLREALEPVSGDASGTEPLLARLAEDRFNLVVLGEWKRGKSSLVNAILGWALLPTAAVPLTSVVTAVSHGPSSGRSSSASGRASRSGSRWMRSGTSSPSAGTRTT
jgi:ribosome biogenesis GTPase A